MIYLEQQYNLKLLITLSLNCGKLNFLKRKCNLCNFNQYYLDQRYTRIGSKDSNGNNKDY